MDVVRDFRRGAVRLHVLHHAAEGAVTGAWMASELARHGYPISPGTLYPLLHDLEGAGLLTSQERVEDGHAVRCYTATDTGRATLTESRTALRELAAELLPSEGAAGSPPRPGSTKTANRPAVQLRAELDRLIRRVRTDSPGGDHRREAVVGILTGLRRLLEEAP